MTASFEPQFLTVGPGPLSQRFAIHHPPQGDVLRGLVVYVHPFAEEMNKSRRMAALQSRALAERGFAVLQMDLLGCGDSEGDFGDASWAQWVDDVVDAAQWLLARHPTAREAGSAPLWLWGQRAGTLVAAEAAAALGSRGVCCDFLFWQPTPLGKPLLQQFLRLKAAGELLAGQAKAAMEQLRSEIAAGRSIEIAGYLLSPALCQGLEQAALRPPTTMPAGRVVWREVSTVEQPKLAPAGAATIGAWQQAGWTIDAQALRGPAFWQTTEIEDAPMLVEATLGALTAPAAQTAAARAAIETSIA